MGDGYDGVAVALYHATLRGITDGVITTSADGRVQFMNPVAEALTERSSADARGQPVAEVWRALPENALPLAFHPIAALLGLPDATETHGAAVIIQNDGRSMPIDYWASAIRDASGKVIGATIVFRDVTIAKRDAARRTFISASAEVFATATDYRDALRLVVELAVPLVADMCAIDILEPRAEQTQRLALAHRDPAMVEIALKLAERYPPNPNGPGTATVIRSGKTELYPRIEPDRLRAHARNDEQRELLEKLNPRSSMIVPLRGSDRVFGALSFVICDTDREYDEHDVECAELVARRAALVIEKRKLEDERAHLLEREQHARREAELANRAKDEFLATISHELKNPLSAILGWSDLLLRRELPAELRGPLEAIERNARAEARLIEDILDFARILTDKLRLQLGRADVGQAANDALESVRPSVDAKGIHLVTRIGRGIVMRADQVRLQQVLTNLLSNAVKFTPAGGGILFTVERREGTVDISVHDSGEGIHEAALKVIFEPFHQVDATPARMRGGLGLGLAIVRRLVEAHGGTVRAESAGAGRGATFFVELPFVEAERTSPSTPPPRRASVARCLEGVRVLVVDDEPDGVALVREILCLAGAAVETASSARAALDVLSAVAPSAGLDLLVSDIAMPELDGYALLREVRALPEHEGGAIPAVALTAYTQDEDVSRAFAAGFQRHVPKPVRADALVDAALSLVRRA